MTSAIWKVTERPCLRFLDTQPAIIVLTNRGPIVPA